MENTEAGEMTFIYQYAPNTARVTLTLHPDSSLIFVLEQFELFLRASGYNFEGILDVVQTPNFDTALGDE